MPSQSLESWPQVEILEFAPQCYAQGRPQLINVDKEYRVQDGSYIFGDEETYLTNTLNCGHPNS